VRRTHGLVVQSRVGLHSGDVVVRAISNDLHMDSDSSTMRHFVYPCDVEQRANVCLKCAYSFHAKPTLH
jgi:hypothetical protein